MFDLTGKKVIVTGGAGDLGGAIVDAFAKARSEVCMIDLSDKADAMAREYCSQGFKVCAVKADLLNREAVDTSFAKAFENLGGQLDVIVNAAGIQKRHKCEDFPLSDWDAVIEINLTVLFRFCQLAGKVMLEQRFGKIINVASLLSFFGGWTVPAYAASKGGVAQVTKALSNEWAGRGVNVNAIAPGYMDTQLNVNLVNDPVRSQDILKRIPQGRWGNGEDIKGAVIFLSSRASDYVNGAVIPIDGGFLAR
jgi:2-deoxy-D-gluconate 3-dehydrogenase